MKLLNPIPNGKMSSSHISKTVEISSFNSDTILSPEQGVVVSSDKFKCNGNIKIEHDIDGESYYTNFCNVGRIMVFRGNQIRRGELIGTVGDSPIELSVTDKSNSKLDVSKFLSGGFNKTKDKDKDKDKDKTLTNFDTTPKKEIPNPFIDVLLSPLSIVNKAFFRENIIGDENLIKEDIDKIKKLIKY